MKKKTNVLSPDTVLTIFLPNGAADIFGVLARETKTTLFKLNNKEPLFYRDFEGRLSILYYHSISVIKLTKIDKKMTFDQGLMPASWNELSLPNILLIPKKVQP